jgi:tetratricopeptide (TPR) repeat protein
VTYFREHGPASSLAVTLMSQGGVLRSLGESRASLEKLKAGLAVLPDEPELQLYAANGRAVAEEQLGDLPAAERDAAFAVTLSQRLRAQQIEVLSLTVQGIIERVRGHVAQARARLDQAVAVANVLGNPRAAEDAQMERARLALALGQHDQALSVARALATRREATGPLALLLDALVAAGELAEAAPIAERLAARLAAEQDWHDRATATLAVARLQLARGDVPRARALVEPLAAEAAKKADPRYGFEARLVLADVLARSGQAAAAHALTGAVAREAARAGYGLYAHPAR